MASGRAGLRAEKVRGVAAWLAVALVAWQAEESARAVAAELGRPFAQHVLALRASPEELIRRKLGEDYAILVALRAEVPREARVRVSFADERGGYKELRRLSTWLGALLYPMVLEGWPFVPERAPPPPGTASTRQREYVLDLESGRDFSAWPCKELARGPGFRLLLVGDEAR